MAFKPPPNDFTQWLTGFAGEEFGLVHKLYEWYKTFHVDVATFPKTERYALGEAIKTRVLFIIEGVWEANTLPLPERLHLLERLQRVLDLVKILVRLVYDMGIYKTTAYLARQASLQEIGRMLGGWRKTTRKKLGFDP